MLSDNGKRFVVLSILSLVFVFSVRTVSAVDRFEWRPVTPAELAMKTPQVEPDADAEAIFWEVRIDDSDSSDLSKIHYVRVKIFTERGRERFSKFDIPFIKKSIKIKDIAARVIRPDGTIIEIKDSDIFEREIIKTNRIKVRAKSFAIPNIEPGVIVEYRYREIFDDSGAVGLELEFQRDIPVQNLSYYYKPYKKNEPRYQPYNLQDVKFVEEEKGFYLAKRTNVPSFKSEPYMPPEDNVRPWMLLQGVGVNLTNVRSSGFRTTFSIAIKNPGNPSQYWGAVASEYAGVTEFMNKKSKDVKKAADEIVGSAATDDEKLRKIYKYCQTEIKNASFDPSMTDEDKDKLPKITKIDDILKHKVVRTQYVDMLFGAMAGALGFETRVVLAPDRTEILFNPNMTNEDFIGPRSVAVKVGENWKFFNPGVPFLPYGKLVWYEEDVWSLLVGEKYNSWEQSPLTDEKENVVKRSGKLKLTEDGTLEGTMRLEHYGQFAIDYRINNYDESPAKREEELIDDFKSRMSTAEISNVVIENMDDHSKPIVQTFKIRVPNYGQRTGKRLFFQPGVFEYGSSPRFSASERKYDIVFNYPWSEADTVDIDLPAGFQLDNAERPADLVDDGKIFSLTTKIGVSQDVSLLKYERNFFFGGESNILFTVSNYKPLKNIFDTVHTAGAYPITLKQVEPTP